MFDVLEFRAQMARCGMTQKDIAAALNINEATLYRKIKRGGDFTRSEITTLIELMNIEDPAAIFFAQELAET